MPSKQRGLTEQGRPEFVGIGLFLVGLFALASLLIHGQGSPPYVPQVLARLLRVVTGSGSYLIAAMLLVVGAALWAGRGKSVNRRVLASLAIFVVCFLLARHVGVPRGMEFETGALHRGGGLIGAGLQWVAGRFLGSVCTWVAIGGALLVAGLLFMDGQTLASREILARSGHFVWRWLAQQVRRRATKPKSQGTIAQGKPSGKTSQQKEPAVPGGSRIINIVTERTEGAPTVDNPSEESISISALTDTLSADAAASEAETSPTGIPTPPLQEPQDASPTASVTVRQAAGDSKSTEYSGEGGRQPPEQLLLLSKRELYQPPPLSLIRDIVPENGRRDDPGQMQARIALLEDTLESFGIRAKVRHCVRGPAVTRYEVEPVRGIRVSRVASLADDLALAFAASHVRVEAPVPGKALIGIEVPNSEVEIVGLRSILETEAYRTARSLLVVAVGKDIAGTPVLADLSRMPHLLIAGATNAGKTICLHCIITSLLMRARPDQVKLILIDPKRVELMLYDGIPHLMAPVVQTAPHAADVLRKVIREMERRYDMFAMKGVVNIGEYNELAAMPKEDPAEDFDPLPYVVVIIDELSELMMQAKAEFEFSICRIAQMSRATGIHLVIATQRPSVNVITGTIKANIPSRIALAVVSQHDSRTIIDTQGAERLIGRGDMLYRPADASKSRRVQGAYISRHDLEAIVEHLREQGEPEYEIIPEVQGEMAGYADESEPSDELYQKAVELVTSAQEASVSMLQRRFKIGYARAGRLIDMMEERGIIGPSEGSKARKVLVPPGYRAEGSRVSGVDSTDTPLRQCDDNDDTGDEACKVPVVGDGSRD